MAKKVKASSLPTKKAAAAKKKELMKGQKGGKRGRGK
jgi:hypothetical protein